MYGRYLFEYASGRPVSLAAPSLHTLYRAEIDYDGYLAVAVSQSGRTPEITDVLARLRAQGARTIVITNDPSSPLAECGNLVVDLGAGEDRAVPATKTFVAQLAAMAVVGEALGRVPWESSELDNVPDVVEKVLADQGPPSAMAEALSGAKGLISVARGFLYAIALEAALKVKETAGLLAEGYSAADLRHGPMAVVEEGFPVLAFSASGPTHADVASLVSLLQERQALQEPSPARRASHPADRTNGERVPRSPLRLVRWCSLS